MKTKITEQYFRTEHPIIQGGMHMLVFCRAAVMVSNAGGLEYYLLAWPLSVHLVSGKEIACLPKQCTDNVGVNLTFYLTVSSSTSYPVFVEPIIKGGAKDCAKHLGGRNPNR